MPPSSREGIDGDIYTLADCPKCGDEVNPYKAVKENNLPTFLYRCGAGHEETEWVGIGKLKDVRVPDDAEALVFQRLTLAHMADSVKMLKARGVAVIVDMDDDLRAIDPDNPAFLAMHKDWGYRHHSQANAMRACLDATWVTVSTAALLRVYAPHGRGSVLHNRVPAGYLDIPHEDNATISWPGSTHSHPRDLQQVGPAVARLLRAGANYWACGSSNGVAKALGLQEEPPASGDVDFAQWPWAVAKIGVGMAPLADTAFNAAKSWLKPLEMSAVGVPWVASPRAEYQRLHDQHQVGLMARTPKEWHRQLRRLVKDDSLRQEQSQAGRAAGAANTVEGHAWRWLEAWTDAITKAQRDARALALG